MNAITGESYTHRAWVAGAGQVIGHLQGLWNALDSMAAQISADGGDQEQLNGIRSWQNAIEGCLAQGRALVAGVNAVQVPVGEAVAAAGGPDSAPNKEYAREARGTT